MGESHVAGVDPNSLCVFIVIVVRFLFLDSVPFFAPLPLVLASAPPPATFANPPTVTLGCPAVGPSRDSRPTQPLVTAEIPAHLHYAGVH